MQRWLSVLAALTFLQIRQAAAALPVVKTDGRSPLDFSLIVFQQVAKSNPHRNVVISPVSIVDSMTLLYVGAAGDTKKTMAYALGLDANLSPAEIAAQVKIRRDEPARRNHTKLENATALFGNKSVSFKNSFVEISKKYFSTDIRTVDFASADAVKTMNDWVKVKTRGKISQIVETLNSRDDVCFCNAVYFKASWRKGFQKTSTSRGTFYLDSSRQKSVMMMRAADSFNYKETADFQAVKLEYKGARRCMYVFLPKEGTSLQSLETRLYGRFWPRWKEGFSPSQGLFQMPRFRVQDQHSLQQELSQAGLRMIFDERKADFAQMIQGRAKYRMGNVLHKTLIDVDEEGTEVAAIAAAGPTVPANKSFQFTVDRPFLIIVEDEQTGDLLFIGHIVDP